MMHRKKTTLLLFLLITSYLHGQDSVRIMKLDKPLHAFGRLGGMTTDVLGNLYVANFHDAVWRISPDGKVKLLSDGLYGSSGNVVDKKGNLYQANFFANSITHIDRFGDATTILEEGLSGPVGLIFDEKENLIVCNCNGNYIAQVSPDRVLKVIAEGELFSCPNGITSDDKGNHYITNFGSDRIVKITPSRETSVFATIPGGEGNAHIVFHKGNLYVTKIKTNTVYRLSLSGKYQLIAGTGKPEITEGPGTQASLSAPNGIASDAARGILYVNNVKGEWQTNDATTIAISVIKLATLTDQVRKAIAANGVEGGKKAFWQYQKDPMHADEDVGPETGTLAWRYMSERNVPAAIMLFTAMTEAYPNRWRAWYYLGEVHKIIGQPEKALNYYKEASKRDKDNTLINARLAELKDADK